MSIDIVLSTVEAEARPEIFDGRVVVAIDVLRATSTAATALANGAVGVLPVAEVDEAREKARSAGQEGAGTVLGGERDGLPIPGFGCGNSPREYTPAVVAGKTVVLTTTNGTRAVRLAAPRASRLYVACFLDLDALVSHLAQGAGRAARIPGQDDKNDVGIVFFASGTKGEPSLEDTTCAALGARLAEAAGLGAMTAQARAAVAAVAGHLEDLPHMMRCSKHGQHLIALGFEADLDFCARRHIYHRPSVLRGDRLVNP